MKVLYKADEWIDVSGKVHVQCDDLVGTGRNWTEPARILGIHPADLIIMLKNEYNANIDVYRKDGKISFIGFNWDTLQDARKFKNFLNAKARTKKHMI